MIEVTSPGAYSTVQDAGRTGHEIHGMPAAGPLDPFLAAVANRIAGNDAGAPLLEFALVGPSFLLHHPARIAVAAYNARYLLNGSVMPEFLAVEAAAGSRMDFTGMQGWFGYIAFAGGIDAPAVLGSASTYIPGRIGRRLVKGDRLRLGANSGPGKALRRDAVGFRSVPVLRILPSIHTSLFSERDLNTLVSDDYKILPNSDRMGIALQGAGLASPRVVHSTPAFPGSIQALPSGQLLLLGPDGPATGGYPQVAMLSRVSWTTIAQARPGQSVRFEWISRERARQMRDFRDSIFHDNATTA